MRIVPFILAFIFNVVIIAFCLFYFYHLGEGNPYRMLAATWQGGGYGILILATMGCFLAWSIAMDESKTQGQDEKSNTQ